MLINYNSDIIYTQYSHKNKRKNKKNQIFTETGHWIQRSLNTP